MQNQKFAEIFKSNLITENSLSSLQTILHSNEFKYSVNYINYEDIEPDESKDICLDVIKTVLELSKSEILIVLIAYTTNRGYLPYSIQKSEYYLISEKLREEESSLFKKLYKYDENLNDPAYVLDDIIEDETKQLSKYIYEVIKKDQWDEYIDTLYGYKTNGISLTQAGFTYKFYLFERKSEKTRKYENQMIYIENNSIDEAMERFEKALQDVVSNSYTVSSVDYGNLSINDESDLKFCETKAKDYISRSNLLKTLELNSSSQFIVVTGQSGSGKTCLLSKISFDLFEMYNYSDTVFIIKYIGMTSDTRDIMQLLKSIMSKLACVFHDKVDKSKTENIELIFNYFKQFVKYIGEKNSTKKIYIIIDSLDQLDDDYNTRKLDWFPVDIPKNIKIITSTLSEGSNECYNAITNMLNQMNAFFIDLNTFNLKNYEIEEIFDEKLKNSNRQLQPYQYECIKNTTENTTNLLYLNLLADEALKLKSYTNVDGDLLHRIAEKVISKFFKNVELKCGYQHTSKAISYITISKQGFSYDDLFKIVDYDMKMNEFDIYGLKLKFLRTVKYLSKYLVLPKLKWFHRKFHEVAVDIYCNDPIETQNLHRNIFNCFSEHISQNQVYWLKELPYHGILSREFDIIKTKYLFNLNFIELKLKTVSFLELVKDYELCAKYDDNSIEVFILYQTLLMIMNQVNSNPGELTSQLVGRLLNTKVKQDPHMESLLEQCKYSQKLAIIPNKLFLASLFKQFETNLKMQQKSVIRSTQETSDGCFLVVTSEDYLLRIYHTSNFQLYKTITKSYLETASVHVSSDDKAVFAWSKISPNNNKQKFCLIEAFDFIDGTKIFELWSNEINSVTNYRELRNGDKASTLWLVDFFKWYEITYDIESKTACIEKYIEIPNIISKKYNVRVVVDAYKENLILTLDTDAVTDIVSMNMNGLFAHKNADIYNFGFKFQVCGRRLLALPNDKLAIVICRDSEGKTGKKILMNYILICNPVTLDMLQLVQIKPGFRLIKSSADGKILTGYSGTKVYVFDFELKKPIYCIEHSKALSSVSHVKDDLIVSVTGGDNKLYIWDLSKLEKSNENLFDNYSNRWYFLTDEYNNQSPLVLSYYLYKLINNCLYCFFFIYDLKQEKFIKKIQTRNDSLLPLSIFCNFFVVFFDFSNENFLFINMETCKVLKRIKSIKNYLFKRIAMHKFILTEKNENNDVCMVMFEFEPNTCDIEGTSLIKWDVKNITWNTINYENVIYKFENEEFLRVYYFKTNISIQLRNVLNKIQFNASNETIVKTYSSNNGIYLVLKIKNKVQPEYSRLISYNIETNEILYEKFVKLDCLLDVMLFDNYLQIKIKDLNIITRFIIDLSKPLDQDNIYEWFKYDSKKISHSLFADSSLNANSKYIWLVEYQQAVVGQAKTHARILVHEKNNFSTCIAIMDVEFKVYTSDVHVINQGTAIVLRGEDANEFVIFNLQSNNIKNQLEFTNYNIENNEIEFII